MPHLPVVGGVLAGSNLFFLAYEKKALTKLIITLNDKGGFLRIKKEAGTIKNGGTSKN